MFCPRCEAEFVAGIERCSDCDVPLLEELPSAEPAVEPDEQPPRMPVGPLVRIPLRNGSDAAMVQSLLKGAGFPFHVSLGLGESADEILVGECDVAEIKDFLNEYMTRTGRKDEPAPIDW